MAVVVPQTSHPYQVPQARLVKETPEVTDLKAVLYMAVAAAAELDQAGINANSSTGGDGGDGLQSSISGTATYYAGGGGGSGLDSSGGFYSFGNGGLGGGGFGSNTTNGVAGSGTANTGSGGGGSRRNGGTGGSGIVIVRYAI